MLVATFYWAAPDVNIGQMKGDKEMYFVQLSVGFAYLVVLANSLLVKNIGCLGILLMPLVSCVLAFFATFMLLALLGLGGTSEELISCYGFLYSAISIIFLTLGAYRRGQIAP